jgi:peptide-methionine (S)-S-oxide reductase
MKANNLGSMFLNTGVIALLVIFAGYGRAQTPSAKTEHATFAMGCFWHSEEMFLETKGVIDALPGYSGGTEKDPSYELVGSGDTRYAESVDITYDPSIISYGKLLQIFFSEHDPTTPNMQYPDIGPQYRSVIFYRNPDQKAQADRYIAQLASAKTFSKPIVTEVVAFDKFYRAEDYHLRYVRNHPNQPYVAGVTKAEIEKFRRDFPDLVK